MVTMSKRNGKPKKRRRSFGRVFRRPGGPPGSWLIQFPNPSRGKTASGRTSYITRSVTSKKEGEQLLRQVKKAIFAGTFLQPKEQTATCDLTLIECIDEYLGAKRAEGQARRG